jgi:hypothetical protein
MRRRRIHGGRLEDCTGVSAPRQLLRYVRWRRGRTRYELLTNALAPARLSAEEALDLYPTAGASSGCSSISRKCSISTACMPPSPMRSQIYAAAIVYNALRVAQSDGAAQVGWAPERLSPAKFFPKVAPATYLSICIGNSGNVRSARDTGVCISGSSADRRCWVRTTLAALEVEHRDDHRRTRRFCPAVAGGSRSLTCVVVNDSRGYLSGDGHQTPSSPARGRITECWL